MRKANLLLCLVTLAACTVSAFAQQKFSSYLNGEQHVSPVNTPATGSGVVTLNTAENQITVTLTYTGLTSPAFAAHLHGPAPVGQNGPVLFNLIGVTGTSGTVTNTFAINAKEVQALKTGRFYFNVHTNAFPNGEIRGQVKNVYVKDDVDGDGRSDILVLRLAPPSANITDIFILRSLNDSLAAYRVPFVIDQSVLGDFNGDGRNELDAIRIDPPTGNDIHHILNLNATANTPFFLRILQWGNNNLGDVPVSGDVDGDAIADAVVFRKSTGSWFALQSSNNTLRAEQFGASSDIPAASDYDKDGRTDLAVVRNVNGQLVWFIRQSSNGAFRALTFGLAASDAVLNTKFFVDFDGDGAADPALVRKEPDGRRVIYAFRSADSSLLAETWGLRTDKTAIADVDGDGKSDLVAIRQIPPNVNSAPFFWFIKKSTDGQLRAIQFGQGTDVAISVD